MWYKYQMVVILSHKNGKNTFFARDKNDTLEALDTILMRNFNRMVTWINYLRQ